MRVKTIRKKGKMKPKEKGRPLPYKNLDKPKSMKGIRGIFKSWQSAPKFILRLQANGIRFYLSKKESLTDDRKLAMTFANGFDSPEVKRKYWSERLGVTFKPENI